MTQSLIDLGTQQWVKATGRRVTLREVPWLRGPVGDTDIIGEGFFRRHAAREGLSVDVDGPSRGLLPEIGALSGPQFQASQLHPQVVRFYQQTAEYSFEVSSEWKGGLRSLGSAIATIFSRRLQQLNLPLSPSDTNAGTLSDVVHVKQGDGHMYSAWVRTLKGSGNTLFAGAYSTATVPGFDGPCVRVVFPLPNGSAIIILRPELAEGGSLALHSDGRSFGEPGFYFYVRRDDEGGHARYVRAMHETLRVFPGDGDEVRAEHHFDFWTRRFLELQYRMRPATTGVRSQG